MEFEISDDLWHRLMSMRKPDESLGEVVQRLCDWYADYIRSGRH